MVGDNRPWKNWPTQPLFPERHHLQKDDRVPAQPELEDQSLITWGLGQSEIAKGPRATIDVLCANDVDLEWHDSVSDPDLERLVSDLLDLSAKSSQTHLNQRTARIFFIRTATSSAGWLPGNFSISPGALRSLRRAGLSGTLLTGLYTKVGRWARMGDHCRVQLDEKGELSTFEVCYRYVCGWDAGACFTQFIGNQNRRTYICINYPHRASDRFKAYVKHCPELVYRDFFLDALAADESLKEFQETIGRRRETLLSHERSYESEVIDFHASTIQLHRLARDWKSMEQDCRDLHMQLEFLQTTCLKYQSHSSSSRSTGIIEVTSSIAESFEALKSQCDNYARWAAVYGDRTNIRINLLFHLANQNESQMSTQIASSTAKVAEQTRRDSSSMITIAAVTMFFLPGTFISAILSTTFFEFGDQGLSVSKSWWILPAATIPLMALVFGLWLGWQYLHFGKAGQKRGNTINKTM